MTNSVCVWDDKLCVFYLLFAQCKIRCVCVCVFYLLFLWRQTLHGVSVCGLTYYLYCRVVACRPTVFVRPFPVAFNLRKYVRYCGTKVLGTEVGESVLSAPAPARCRHAILRAARGHAKRGRWRRASLEKNRCDLLKAVSIQPEARMWKN